MKNLPILIATVLMFSAGSSFALTPQQEKMKTCNADAKAKALAGEERKTFMKGCLSAGGDAAPAATLTPQQEKMKTCNADAKAQGKTGPDRKKFMSECLSGGTGAGATAPAVAAIPAADSKAVAVSPKKQQREACREQAKAQGITEREKRKEFVASCMGVAKPVTNAPAAAPVPAAVAPATAPKTP